MTRIGHSLNNKQRQGSHGDQLADEFAKLKLAINPAITGVALMKHLYDKFTSEVRSNSIQFIILSQFDGREIGEITYRFLSKENDCEKNCENILAALSR